MEQPKHVSAMPQPPPNAVRRASITIQHKLVGLMLLMTVSQVGFLTLYFPAMQIAALQRGLEQKANTYAKLVAQQVRSAIAFDDKETARETFDALAQDPLVDSIVLFTGDGQPLHTYGTPSDEALAARSGVGQALLFELPDRILSVAPVVSAEGPRGTLTLELSRRTLQSETDKVQQTAILVGGAAVVLGLLAAWLIARSISSRIQLVANAATRVAAGALDEPAVVDNQHDEISVMADAFNTMVSQIRGLFERLERNAQQEQARLEAMVEERTIALKHRNDDMRLMLDNLNQGFLTIDRNGVMSRERSLALTRWLGPAPADCTLWDYIEQVAPGNRDLFEMGWEEVLDGMLPLDLTLEQMPASFSTNDRHFAVSYAPIGTQDASFTRMLVVITDVTDEQERARAEVENREIAGIFSHIMRDRTGFLDFVLEAQGIVQTLTEFIEPIKTLMRAAHTLKGNSGIFGLHSIVEICHRIETHLQEEGTASVQDLSELRARWELITDRITQITGDEHSDANIELGDEEYQDILRAVHNGLPHGQISEMIQAWTLEPTIQRLDRISHQVHSLAKRLGKDPVEVVVEHNRVRLDADRFAPFWSSLIHVVRNAIDHGLETPDERHAAGKAGPARLTLRTTVKADVFRLEVEDNGRGIQWELVRDKARSRRLPHTTHRELVDALFSDGLSTKLDVTDLSGRGVGLSAVRQACVELGGNIEIDSQQGAYTRMIFSWPLVLSSVEPAPSDRPIWSPSTTVSIGVKQNCSMAPPSLDAQHPPLTKVG